MKIRITGITSPQFNKHRSKFMVHGEDSSIIAEFSKYEQLKRWAELVGVKLGMPRADYFEGLQVMEYRTEQIFHTYEFFRLRDIPLHAESCQGVSYGNLVTCYVHVIGNVTTIYRPNPLHKDVFLPLEVANHIKFIEENGTFNKYKQVYEKENEMSYFKDLYDLY
ncbi:hypothetical protein P4493_05935 [Bacillus thuringiensis]|jgi:hypothetical protein|uniref:Uncharacterized protein n=3 Tax=Bacillus thuringiensis TaxID=1428 RepID=A0A0B5NJT6_BACTU|nr:MULTISPECIES: hypothetical protein [Bacillus]EAO55629.1 hypothetical protein RBTH_06765 [Bacillus thuringiensis serovar israelensis ATCC 35646]MEC2533103.1 hypothetical protein [Bacillus cereus]MED1153917.1 hypothetical protein [Bacillus paranthracis]OUB09240.1 hypothetical protein BK708_32415 [Bacillus thuringiensis serovar yunnanensis]AFQ29790.1 hypothetical protein BTF1_28447 [Bacillus thuringiensis HD-789]